MQLNPQNTLNTNTPCSHNLAIVRSGTPANTKLDKETILLIGIMLALTGAGLSVFTWINTLTREETLGNTNLSIQERWQIEGALQWWKDFGIHFSYPFAAILIIGGLTVTLTTRLGSPSRKEENPTEKHTQTPNSNCRTLDDSSIWE